MTAPRNAIAVLMLPMLLLRTGPADDWPHWRGSQRNDIVAESSGWGLGGWTKKNVQWTTQVGEGATSPIVVGPHVYVMGWKGNEDTVTCLNDASGVPQWRQSYRCRRYGRNAMGDQGLYSGPTSSPEFDTETGFLFTLSCDGDLHCWDTKKQGEKVWHINLYDKYEMPQRPKVGRSGRRDYGYTTAPLIYGKQLIVEGGGNAGAIVAFDKHTGRQRWASQAKSFAGHTGGLALINVQRVPCVAALTFNGLLVVRLDAGREGQTVATHPWITSFGNNIASPAVHDNFVLITSGYTQNAMCKLQVSLSGARVVWKQENLVSKTCTPVVHNGRIYWAWNRLHCVDFATGKPIWNGPRVGDAGSCIVTNDDKLIVWANEGDLFLAETASKSRPDYQELARLRGLGQGDVWPHIVLAGGKLYCKDRRGRINCLAIDGRAANASAAER